jgi:hypothetical protein
MYVFIHLFTIATDILNGYVYKLLLFEIPLMIYTLCISFKSLEFIKEKDAVNILVYVKLTYIGIFGNTIYVVLLWIFSVIDNYFTIKILLYFLIIFLQVRHFKI